MTTKIARHRQRKKASARLAAALAARGYSLAVHYHTSAAEAKETIHQPATSGARTEVFQPI
jgi:hypothetical protein